MVSTDENNPFLFALVGIKRNLDFCIKNKIQEAIQDPALLQSMSMLYTELSKYNLDNYINNEETK